MGSLKDQWIEAQERGWSAPDTHVCADCVEDPFLKELIEGSLCWTACDYCGRTGSLEVATETKVVVDAVYGAVGAYYAEPARAGVPYDGGFLIKPIDIEQVLWNIGFDGHPDLVRAVIDSEANGDYFVPAPDGHWASRHPHQVLSSAWDAFCYAVKHETRFHFTAPRRSASWSPYELDVADVLPTIADRLRPLVTVLPVGTRVYRARVRRRGEKWSPSAEQMGAPPKEIAGAGRMNPAGIPYLYAAFDQMTARREVGVMGRTSHKVFMATYALQKSLIVLDLTLLPDIPSLFDVENKDARERILFMRSFVEDISSPVRKSGSDRIEYVPTQVVCEYMAQVFKPNDCAVLGGMIYPSAVHPGGRNLVVFPEDRYERTYHGVSFLSAGK